MGAGLTNWRTHSLIPGPSAFSTPTCCGTKIVRFSASSLISWMIDTQNHSWCEYERHTNLHAPYYPLLTFWLRMRRRFRASASDQLHIPSINRSICIHGRVMPLRNDSLWISLALLASLSQPPSLPSSNTRTAYRYSEIGALPQPGLSLWGRTTQTSISAAAALRGDAYFSGSAHTMEAPRTIQESHLTREPSDDTALPTSPAAHKRAHLQCPSKRRIYPA